MGVLYRYGLLWQHTMVKEAHPFSVASVPKDSPRKVTFMVHRLGDFTRQVNKILRGTKVKLEGAVW